MADRDLIIACPNCAGLNRIAAGRDPGAGKCGKCSSPLFTGAPVTATAANFVAHTQRSDIPAVVDFWADWCGPCHAMAPAFAQVARQLEPHARFLKLDTEAERPIASRFNIRSIPTLMVFRKGEVVAQTAGAMPAQSLRAWLAQAGI